MPTLLDGQPLLYQRLLPAFFRSPIPPEAKATCHACAMCQGSAQGTVESVDGASRLFRPDTKCCTYHPRLPNYLVGGLLADTSQDMAEGRRRMREKLAARVGINPQWVRPPARYLFLYRNSRQFFGRATTLLCPFYESQGGGCTLWPYRESVCATWFCKFVAGEDGRKMWMSLKAYLTLVEVQLSRYVLLQLLPDYILKGQDKADAQSHNAPLTAEELDDRPPSNAEYAALWGTWVGREEEFYRSCHEQVCALAPDSLEKLLGLDGTVEQALLRRAWQAAVAPQLPRFLRLNPEATVKWLPDGSVALASYSEHDALALPGEAYTLLTLFSGREPLEAVRQRMREEKQADMTEDVLLELYRHRILVEARPA